MTKGKTPLWRPLELWGGHECTVNRVGERWRDQTAFSGHYGREGDIDLFAGLGIKRLRYPVLWEKVSPVSPSFKDYSVSDQPLRRMREFGISPIVGLLHHGSGPVYTDLLDPGFAEGLALHARHTAERYPWVTDWTPVNEPLTTARFSALYGHWYPHRSDEASFWLAMLNQIDGIRFAMKAIRVVNPTARLVQTEDMGKTFATARMRGQAEFDNLRRWLTWDLLAGRVTRLHPMWERLRRFGMDDRARLIADDACPPDVIGVNHYLTSDRFLDHRVDEYPPESRGSNSYGTFADVEEVRVLEPREGGLRAALDEVWNRYRLPIAITEVHNGCTREEQMRWFLEAWTVARSLRADGVDIRAVTAWSLLGAFDWNSLLTQENHAYECGVFDVRSGEPRPTAMVPLLKALVSGVDERHPVLSRPGWWHLTKRLQYQRFGLLTPSPVAPPRLRLQLGSPILITGATGTLGKALGEECAGRDIPYLLADRSMLRLNDRETADRLLREIRPWAVINAAGWVDVDKAESNEIACFQANRDGNLALAEICSHHGIAYTTFSSDLVFDGEAGRAYAESDSLSPLSVYGRSKAEADISLLAHSDSILIIRTAAFFSHRNSHNFAMHVVQALAAGHNFQAANCAVSPTLVSDLTRATLDLVIDKASGLWHVCNQGQVTWAGFAQQLAEATGLPDELVVPVPLSQMPWSARRPTISALVTERGQLLPTLDTAIGAFAQRLRDACFPSGLKNTYRRKPRTQQQEVKKIST